MTSWGGKRNNKENSNFILIEYIVSQSSDHSLGYRSSECLHSQCRWKLLHCFPKRYSFHCALWRISFEQNSWSSHSNIKFLVTISLLKMSENIASSFLVWERLHAMAIFSRYKSSFPEPMEEQITEKLNEVNILAKSVWSAGISTVFLWQFKRWDGWHDSSQQPLTLCL